MRVLITPQAERHILHQLEWGKEKHGLAVAEKIFTRIQMYIDKHIAVFPKAAGVYIPEKGIYQAVVTKTPFVLMYRIEGQDTVRILALFHTAEQRDAYEF